MIEQAVAPIIFKAPEEYKPGGILIPSDKIEVRLNEMADEIYTQFQNGQELLVVGLLTGAAFVTVDLFTRLYDRGLRDSELDFMRVSSYPNGTVAQHEPRIEYDTSSNPYNRNILIIDDIADTGKSLKLVKTLFESKEAKKVTTAVLLNKPSRRQVDFEPDHVGFTIPDAFVVGFGLDYNKKWRGAKDILVWEASADPAILISNNPSR